MTGLFAIFALLRAAICDDLDITEPQVLVVFNGEHGSTNRTATNQEYKANRKAPPEALKPLQFLARSRTDWTRTGSGGSRSTMSSRHPLMVQSEESARGRHQYEQTLRQTPKIGS
ncbi:hypothetical protein ACFVTF_24560 [Kitasatospora sp. NPDC057940]|uniref:hypothetical protein n=1 Tax=Kitasatospora sp. NPDC057940 TaxID=3346285 RepID=UPI0036DCC2D1